MIKRVPVDSSFTRQPLSGSPLRANYHKTGTQPYTKVCAGKMMSFGNPECLKSTYRWFKTVSL
ncbi:hypothetical protein [Methylomonas albis]|nr:hypothetical protein [Methylomonas albis]